jgi:hypothetical protein
MTSGTASQDEYTETYAPVEILLRSVQLYINHNSTWTYCANTWLRAFAQFKDQRKLIGLPTTPNSCLAYGVIVAELKAVGKRLQLLAFRNQFIWDDVQCSEADFGACVRELECDDVILGLGDNANDPKLDALFADAERG